MAFLLCFGYLAASPARIYDSRRRVTISFVRACLENTQVKVRDVVSSDHGLACYCQGVSKLALHGNLLLLW